MDFIQKIIYFILELQGKKLKKQSLCHTFSSSSAQKSFNCAATLELNTEKKKKQLKLDTNVTEIIKKFENSPEKLLAFVRKQGTEVYKIPHAKKILKAIGFEEGFIGETKGTKALYLNIVTSIASKEGLKLSFTKAPVFIVSNLELDKLLMIQQFHKWYAMKLELPGFDEKSQENFQKFMEKSNDTDIKELTIDEIIGLKEAIARDVEAINFAIDLAKSGVGSQQAHKKITSGGASV